MARKTWAAMRSEVFQLVNEDNTGHWSDTDMLVLFNQEKDFREMELMDQHEGWGVHKYSQDTVADQAEYELPEAASRVRRVVLQNSGSTSKRVLTEERFFDGYLPGDSSSSNFDISGATFRLEDNFIILTPAPGSAVTNGLEIWAETVTDDLANDTDKLPDSWPEFVETLLVLDTAIAALDQQRAESEDVNENYKALEKRRARYEDKFFTHTSRRTRSRIFGKRHSLGA